MLTVSTKKKVASTKIYRVEFCKVEYTNDVDGPAYYVYSSKDDTKIIFDDKLLIREDEIEKYKNYGGGIKSLVLVGFSVSEEPTCNCGPVCECKCSHEETEENLIYEENKEDPDAFVLKFIPEEGGEACAEITYHNGMYSLVGTLIELQENSEIGLNGSKVYNKFLFRRGGDTEFMPITYQQAREIKDELEE